MFKLGSDGSSWLMHSGFGLCVDFCIWVLEIDGLLVPPFNHHVEGNQRLREAGMDAESWFNWLTRVVVLQDQRLRWNAADSNFLAHEERRLRWLYPDEPPPDRSVLEERNEHYLRWLRSQYEQALSAAREVFGTEELPSLSDPPELWPGGIAVQEHLREMWRTYELGIFGRREQQFINSEVEFDSSSVYQRLPSPGHSIAALELYFVAYPQSVELIFPPSSAILSVRNPWSQTALADRIITVSERLVEINNSI